LAKKQDGKKRQSSTNQAESKKTQTENLLKEGRSIKEIAEIVHGEATERTMNLVRSVKSDIIKRLLSRGSLRGSSNLRTELRVNELIELRVNELMELNVKELMELRANELMDLSVNGAKNENVKESKRQFRVN